MIYRPVRNSDRVGSYHSQGFGENIFFELLFGTPGLDIMNPLILATFEGQEGWCLSFVLGAFLLVEYLILVFVLVNVKIVAN